MCVSAGVHNKPKNVYFFLKFLENTPLSISFVIIILFNITQAHHTERGKKSACICNVYMFNILQ
jgi:hypothetical protein